MIEALSSFHFIRPAGLLLIPLAATLWWFWRRRADPLRGWREQMDSDLLEALTVGQSSSRDYASYGLLGAWIVAAIAIAGPTWKPEPNPFAADAQPLIILLKASQSMQLLPPSPSRLERAQLKIADLAQARKGQPLGLVAYAGSAHLVLPPTQDTSIVAQMAAEISPEIMPVPGDRLDLAIQKAGELLQEGLEGGSLLVIADAAETDPQTIAAANGLVGSPPVQLLALTGADSPEIKTLRNVARSLNAPVRALTADDGDINAIVNFAERNTAATIAGESGRWQEVGYWLTPLLALMVAFSFRRQKLAARGES
ncbi:vWA domain-containing protein [Nitrosococcus watsonii]|uniref:vWA domain-containing protein n=1 Tax=Nitrosococcus watsonii TaxID=473531 RepID=UPI0002F684EE|nr:VWA domain-containing protein [Nitrosococcus watsonii]